MVDALPERRCCGTDAVADLTDSGEYAEGRIPARAGSGQISHRNRGNGNTATLSSTSLCPVLDTISPGLVLPNSGRELAPRLIQYNEPRVIQVPGPLWVAMRGRCYPSRSSIASLPGGSRRIP